MLEKSNLYEMEQFFTDTHGNTTKLEIKSKEMSLDAKCVDALSVLLFHERKDLLALGLILAEENNLKVSDINYIKGLITGHMKNIDNILELQNKK